MRLISNPSGSKGVGVDKGEPPKWGGRLSSAVLGRGMADPKKQAPLHVYYLPNLVVLGQRVQA